MAGPALLYEGYALPFSQWPKELQTEYTFDKEGAKKLLTEAGYPTGFKTNVLAPNTADTDLLQVVKAMFLDVGVDMEIKVVDSATFTTTLNNSKQDQMSWGSSGYQVPPWIFLNRRYSTHQLNYTHNNDKTYDALVDSYYASVDLAQSKQICVEADQYVIKMHWAANLPVPLYFSAYQPWWKGYSGEQFIYAWDFIAARTWIDKALKK
jgi:ABC-type transport system substrate-binding protein